MNGTSQTEDNTQGFQHMLRTPGCGRLAVGQAERRQQCSRSIRWVRCLPCPLHPTSQRLRVQRGSRLLPTRIARATGITERFPCIAPRHSFSTTRSRCLRQQLPRQPLWPKEGRQRNLCRRKLPRPGKRGTNTIASSGHTLKSRIRRDGKQSSRRIQR